MMLVRSATPKGQSQMLSPQPKLEAGALVWTQSIIYGVPAGYGCKSTDTTTAAYHKYIWTVGLQRKTGYWKLIPETESFVHLILWADDSLCFCGLGYHYPNERPDGRQRKPAIIEIWCLATMQHREDGYTDLLISFNPQASRMWKNWGTSHQVIEDVYLWLKGRICEYPFSSKLVILHILWYLPFQNLIKTEVNSSRKWIEYILQILNIILENS